MADQNTTSINADANRTSTDVSGDAKKNAPAEPKKADAKKADADPRADADEAEARAREAQQRAHEADAKAREANKTDEQRAADKAWQDADDARAHAAQAGREQRMNPEDGGTPLINARVVAPNTPHDEDSGHHWAQKFGNDPANPAPATGEHVDPDKMTVRLERITPDHPGAPVVTYVHPEMVGDYLRAGWSRAVSV
jgi:hypothetical protein